MDSANHGCQHKHLGRKTATSNSEICIHLTLINVGFSPYGGCHIAYLFFSSNLYIHCQNQDISRLQEGFTDKWEESQTHQDSWFFMHKRGGKGSFLSCVMFHVRTSDWTIWTPVSCRGFIPNTLIFHLCCPYDLDIFFYITSTVCVKEACWFYVLNF